MPILKIAEFAHLTFGGAAPILPPLVEQAVQITQKPVLAKPFHKNTILIRLSAEHACTIAVGTNPKSDPQMNIRLNANVPEYFGVMPDCKLLVLAEDVL